jgi:L-ascorbate metabolism protein UlaG (beta-lactamase superfamily)
MIRPVLQDEAFLADVESVRSGADGEGPHLWWLGQSGYLIHWQGRCLVLDPYLSDSLTRKYAATDKPHVRMTERVVEPGRLAGVIAVTSSHAHTDHLDPETLNPLAAANPELRLVGPESIRRLMQERSGLPDARILGLDAAGPGGLPAAASETVTVGAFRFTAVPAAHERLDRDASGRLLYLGYLIQVGPWLIYHSGDTLRYEGMVEQIRAAAGGQGIDVALLPINGRGPERRVSGNLWGREAAQLARDLEARWVIPGHYELFTFNTASPEDFQDECHRLGQAYRVLKAGERWGRSLS